MTTASATALVPRLSTAAEARAVTRCDPESTAAGVAKRDRRPPPAAAQTEVFGSEAAREVASELFTLANASGASGASGPGGDDGKYGLSRHWRNTRTPASHDPVDWKYHHAGNYLLNSVAPPNYGQI